MRMVRRYICNFHAAVFKHSLALNPDHKTLYLALGQEHMCSMKKDTSRDLRNGVDTKIRR